MRPNAPLDTDHLQNTVRLRTLVVLRWVAIVGQIGAVTAAQRVFGLQFEVTASYLAIGLAVMGNLIVVAAYPANKRLSRNEAFAMLLFDLLQLAFLLSLTGGLNNPFSLLILAPVIIAATSIGTIRTAVLGGVAICAVTAAGLWHVAILTPGGFALQMPTLLGLGFWGAILVGISFIAFYTNRVAAENQAMSDALLATQMALAREQKLTDLGGVVAAAAHELGTPLATIKLVSAELLSDLSDGDQRDDVALIRDQADRCRDILRSMGRAGKDDRHMRRAPLETVVREAAEPHLSRGKDVQIDVAPRDGGDAQQPQVLRKPEIVHGIRNLVQNAVDFATEEVLIRVGWSQEAIVLDIVDDGPGFPALVRARIGDPFVRRRTADPRTRPEYDGMGLGLFIAKTLLERTGAELQFENGARFTPLRGAHITVRWSRQRIEAVGATGAANDLIG
ncbi:MAG: sensor histidine kinase RegB [Shimia sp.]